MKKMSNFIVRYLKYIFWRNYMWQIRTWSERSQPAVTAVTTVTLLLLFHMLIFLALLQVITGVPILKAEKYKNLIGIGAILFLWVLPYVYFIQSGRYKQILKEYVAYKETRFQAIWRAAAIMLHFIACFVSLTILGLIEHHLRGG